MALGIILLLICLGTIQEQCSWCVSGQVDNNAENHLEMYKKMLALKRKEQIETAEQVWSIGDYAKQYKTIKFLMETIFPLLEHSLLEVAQMKYVPDDPFPDELERREVLGKIYENVLFFGDVLLRMPDMTKKVYRERKREWRNILEESLQFCNASKQMAQEIGIIPEDSNFVNPFRLDNSADKAKAKESSESKKRAKKKSRPKLRGSKLEL